MLKPDNQGTKEEIYEPVLILHSNAENLDKTATNNANTTLKKLIFEDHVVLDLHSTIIKY